MASWAWPALASLNCRRAWPKLVRAGTELGHADDLVHGRSNSKQTTGSIGILTHGKYVRAQFYTPAVMMAFIRFVNEGMY